LSDLYGVGYRYARAFYESLGSDDSRKKALTDLMTLGASLAKSPELKKFLGSPVVSMGDKQKMIESLETAEHLSKATTEFLKFLNKKKRIDALPDLIKAFGIVFDEKALVARGTVKSAKALSADEQDAILKKVSSTLGKTAKLDYEVDPSLVGGVTAQVGSYRFDDTLDTHLNSLGQILKGRLN
jgi:F-type H+-transporting ATPase subunit delta